MLRYFKSGAKEKTMYLDPILIEAIVALGAGILILVRPALLNIAVAVYLIVIGVLRLLSLA
jgi:hypothetical protein